MVMLMVAVIPSIAYPVSAAGNDEVTPVLYIPGYKNSVLYANPDSAKREKVFPPDINTDVKFGQYLGTYIGLILEGEYSTFTEVTIPEITSWFAGVRCNFDGTSQNGGVGVMSFNTYDADGTIVAHPMSLYENNKEFQTQVAGEVGLIYAEAVGEDNVYVYSSDWRLDPITRAAELREMVKQVKEQTGAKQVNMVSEGMGSIVASVYLDKYAVMSDLKNYVTLDSAAMGASIFGDLFRGKIDIDPNGLVRYINDLPDNVITAGAFYLVTRILNHEWEIYDGAANVDLYLIHEKDRIYNIWVRELINVMPGLWAMVPYEYFDEAMAFMYPTTNHQPINNTLKAQIEEYHAIQFRASENIIAAKKAGVNVAVVSGYGMQSLPFTKSGTIETGDRVVDTRYSGYGAETAFLNDIFVGKGLTSQLIDDGHDHTDRAKNLFPFGLRQFIGAQVDASTCALPENTWFVYGFKNGYWNHESDSIYYFMTWLGLADKERTIHQDPYFPQFMVFNRNAVPETLYARKSTDVKRFYQTGDVDLNGIITANDARLALRHSAELITLTRAAFKNADLNGDGEVTAGEARKILRVSAQLEKFVKNEVIKED